LWNTWWHPGVVLVPCEVPLDKVEILVEVREFPENAILNQIIVYCQSREPRTLCFKKPQETLILGMKRSAHFLVRNSTKRSML